VDIVVKGRHTEVSERFRRHVAEKLSKIEKFDPKAIRVDVEVSREHNPRLSDRCERVELTCVSRGPVIRAEASADDTYAALDIAYGRLESRLRRAADRRRVHHGNRTPVSVSAATAALAVDGTGQVDSAEEAVAPAVSQDSPIEVDGDGPLVVRVKTHQASPMTLDQALYEMELVGHDFFLFVDAASSQPSVVYRRRGYDYGVIRLAV
jgi:ribosomal subunit interface protein